MQPKVLKCVRSGLDLNKTSQGVEFLRLRIGSLLMMWIAVERA